MIVKSIGVLSMGKMLGMTYACIGLLLGGIVTLLSLAGMAGGGKGLQALVIGVGSVIIVPIFYGIIGFIGGIISAAIYNMVAGMAGGIEIELVENSSASRGAPSRRDDQNW